MFCKNLYARIYVSMNLYSHDICMNVYIPMCVGTLSWHVPTSHPALLPVNHILNYSYKLLVLSVPNSFAWHWSKPESSLESVLTVKHHRVMGLGARIRYLSHSLRGDPNLKITQLLCVWGLQYHEFDLWCAHLWPFAAFLVSSHPKFHSMQLDRNVREKCQANENSGCKANCRLLSCSPRMPAKLPVKIRVSGTNWLQRCWTPNHAQLHKLIKFLFRLSLEILWCPLCWFTSWHFKVAPKERGQKRNSNPF